MRKINYLDHVKNSVVGDWFECFFLYFLTNANSRLAARGDKVFICFIKGLGTAHPML
jgi:hypothetical protein